MEEEGEPLIGGRRRRRVPPWMMLVVVVALVGVAAFRKERTRSMMLWAWPDDDDGPISFNTKAQHSSAFYDSFLFQEKHFGSRFDYVWGENPILEEHVVRDSKMAGDMTREAYAFWRLVLEPPGAHTYVHGSVEDLLDAVEGRRISRGALVFVDVVYWSLEKDPVAEGSIPDDVVYAKANKGDGLDSLCVYQHTPDILKRSKVLRALLSYPEPLVLILAGDIGCRLSSELPETHHAVFFAGDGAPTDRWFPQGLELSRFEKLDNIKAALADAKTEAGKTVADRSSIFDLRVSTNGRKPSRERLLKMLAVDGLSERLEALGPCSVAADLAPESLEIVRGAPGVAELDPPEIHGDGAVFAGTYSFGEDHGGSPIFSLAPAGDVWSSGRVVESLLRGEVPVVDSTYLADGGVSAKGCVDPAAFWRDGDARFPGAPFLFVDDWARLPDLLRDFGATNKTLLRSRLRDIRDYRAKLLDYLRTSVVGAALDAQRRQPTSTCTTLPLSPEQKRAQVVAAETYYGDSQRWLFDYQDSPALPGAFCTLTYEGKTEESAGGAFCFSEACAPPQVSSFKCAIATRSSSSPSS